MRFLKRAALLTLLLLAAGSASAAAEPSKWRQLGPYQLGWAQVNVLTFDPQRPSRAFAGLEGGGIARSDDGGHTWRLMSDGLTASQVRSIVVHPALGRLVYAVAGGLVHRSSDGGTTWVRLPLDRIQAIAPDPRNPAVVWAGGETGLFRSPDSGNTWESIRANLPAGAIVRALAVDTRVSRRIYLGIVGARGASGFWVSENGGRQWTHRNRAVPSALYADLHTAGTVYVLHSEALFRSRDSGQTLQPFFEPSLAHSAVAGLAPDPRNASVFFVIVQNPGASPPAVFRTATGGRTWRPFIDGLPARPDARAIAVSSDGHVLFGTWSNPSRFAAFRSEAAAPAWEPAAYGLVSTSIDAVAVGRGGALFASFFDGGVLRSLDGGATWTVSNPAGDLLSTLVAAPSDPDTLYAGSRLTDSAPNIVWRTTDGGETWTALPYPLPPAGPGNALAVTGIAVDPADARTVYLSTVGAPGAAGLFRSRDGGQTWQKLGSPPGDYLGVTVAPGDPETVFAIFSFTEVHRSTDRGETWTRVLERGGELLALSHVVVAPSNPDVVYVTQDDGTLFRSGDGGATFESLGKRLPSVFLSAIVVDPRDSDTLLFQGAQGVVRLTLGRGRELLGPVFFAGQVRCLLFDPDDPSRLLAGLESAGVMEYRFETP